MATYEPDVAAAKEVPFVPAHPVGWQRPSDFGVIAEIDAAAAWVRHVPAEDNPRHIDEHSPVVTIAVRDGVRGKGIGETGRALLEATHSVRRSLDAHETNAAMLLGEPVRARLVRGQCNRVGTRSSSMVHGEGSGDR
jgi:GNAT superfamily N-acetyltransferase